MQDLFTNNEQESFLFYSVEELKEINKQLAALILRKEEVTQQIIGALQHNHEGQKTYQHTYWHLEVKTPCVYSLNKKKYESGEFILPTNFNPVKESVSYSIDKRLCEQYMQEAPVEVRDTLAELIDKKPGKAAITIKELL